jgi:hypothetical protein
MKTVILILIIAALSTSLLMAIAFPHQTYKIKVTFSHLTFEEEQNLPTDQELQQDFLNGWVADPNSANFANLPTVQVSQD